MTQPVPMSPEAWQLALRAMSAGDLVVFPTDTVYGIACDPRNPAAIDKLFAAKGRDQMKAIPLLLSSADRAEDVSPGLPPPALALGRELWPGALTLIVPRAMGLPDNLGGGRTIAIRVPDHDLLRGFLE